MKLFFDIAKYYLYFIILLLWSKIFFIFINYKNFLEDFVQLPFIWWNGLSLDLSLISYTIIPLLALYVFTGDRAISRRIFKGYIISLTAIIIVVLSVDPFFYKYWGGKVSLLFMQYIGEPKSAIASIEWLDLAYSFLFMLFCTRYAYRFIKKWDTLATKRGFGLIIILLVVAYLGRGGFGKNPIGISSAYYHQKALYNNAALNPVWNLVAYEIDRESQSAVEFISQEQELLLMEEWKQNNANSIGEIEFRDSSKVYLIVLESFTNKNSLLFSGNLSNITPNLDRLAREGLFFTRAYSSSFRSDRGLTALISGIPSLATQTLTNRPELLNRVPNLFKIFHDNGWYTSFHYGGNLDFANLRVLVNDADLVKEQSDFSSSESGAWGFHDEVVFDAYLKDAMTKHEKAFHMLFSSSSHEPFKVPNFNKHTNSYENSIAYADSCLGVLLNGIKELGDWDNSLVIITADHGTIMPERSVGYKSVNFNVPIVVAGGLLSIQPHDTLDEKGRIGTIVSQFDIPKTLVDALGQDELFEFSHSLMNPRGMAFYNYYNGIVLISDSCKQFYDIPQKKYLHGSCGRPFEKAYFQSANRKIYKP
ncbi:MAG: sulfatase-like hydrolase/transferase [Bacteroidia bacterium]